MNENEFKAAIDNAIHTNFHGIDFSVVGARPLHFRYLAGDVDFVTYGGKWVSKAFSNGEFDYYLVIELRNNHEDLGDENLPTYHVSIEVVSPQAAGERHLKDAFESCGLPDELLSNAYIAVEALSDYGISATVWNVEGNNWRKLMTEAHRQALFVNSFFGFYMDVPENRIGNTGWDFVAGNIGFGV